MAQRLATTTTHGDLHTACRLQAITHEVVSQLLAPTVTEGMMAS